MKINKVKISNILGIDEMEFDAGKFVDISGKNGAGKTSIIEAIKSGLKGGNDVTLLRNGATKGEVVLEFDNGITLNRSYKDKSKLNVLENGKPIPQPQSFINDLIDMLSVNPIEFLLKKDKERAETLLGTLQIKIEQTKIENIIGDYVKEALGEKYKEIIELPDGLEVLDKLYKEIFSERTIINRSIKEKQAATNQLRESIQDFEVIPGALESEIKELESEQQKRLKKKEEYLDGINKEFQAKVDEIEAMKQKLIEDTHQRKQELQATFEAKYNPAEHTLSVLREQLKRVGAVNNTIANIDKNQEDIEKLATQETDLSNALDGIKELKLGALSKLPIKGLEVRDGQIYKDKVPFERLNTAEQIKVAIEVAKLRAGELGIICLDGLERFDKDTYEVFKEEILKTNLQAIVTRVSDEELKVRSN